MGVALSKAKRAYKKGKTLEERVSGWLGRTYGYKCKERAKWIHIPLFLLLYPLITVILYPFPLPSPFSEAIMFLKNSIGFYYLESISMVVVIFFYSVTCKKTLIPKVGLLSLVILPIIIFILIPHAQFQNELINSICPTQLINEARISNDIVRRLAFLITIAFGDARVHGLLGALLGVICIYITYIGSICKYNEKVYELSKILIGYLSVFSVVISIALFVLNARTLYYSLQPIFAISSLLLATLFITTGYLTCDGGIDVSFKPYLFFVLSAISFCVGFVFGDLALAATLFPFLDPQTENSQLIFEDKAVYHSFPGIFVFLCLSSILTSIITYILHDEQSPLAKYLLEKIQR